LQHDPKKSHQEILSVKISLFLGEDLYDRGGAVFNQSLPERRSLALVEGEGVWAHGAPNM
jgi:hypothetical protein